MCTASLARMLGMQWIIWIQFIDASSIAIAANHVATPKSSNLPYVTLLPLFSISNIQNFVSLLSATFSLFLWPSLAHRIGDAIYVNKWTTCVTLGRFCLLVFRVAKQKRNKTEPKHTRTHTRAYSHTFGGMQRTTNRRILKNCGKNIAQIDRILRVAYRPEMFALNIHTFIMMLVRFALI